jgi:integrase/recombinase XerD
MATTEALAPTRRLTELTLEFLACLELERGLSRNTLEAYRSDPQQYGVFLGRRGVDPFEVTPEDLAACAFVYVFPLDLLCRSPRTRGLFVVY